MRGFSLAKLIVALFAWVAIFPTACWAAGAKKGTKGVVEVEYVISDQGSRKGTPPASSEWRGSRTIKLSFEVVAGDVQTKPLMLPGIPKGKTSFATRSEAKGKKHEKTLGSMEAAIAKCKGDQDCEMRVAMEFMGTEEGSAMMGDFAAVGREASGAEGGPRYQHWSAVDPGGKVRALSGTFAIDQYTKDVEYTYGKNNVVTTVTETKGSGPLPPAALQTLGGLLHQGGILLDTQEKLFALGLPPPMGVAVQVREDVQDSELGKSSTQKSVVWLEQVQKVWEQGFGAADLPYTEPLREMRGEFTQPIERGYGPKLAVRWRFTVKP